MGGSLSTAQRHLPFSATGGQLLSYTLTGDWPSIQTRLKREERNPYLEDKNLIKMLFPRSEVVTTAIHYEENYRKAKAHTLKTWDSVEHFVVCL